MFYNDRPKIAIEKDQTDRIVDIAIWVIVIGMFVVNLYIYSDLPDKIPAHFSLDGTVNRYDDKSFIWLMPIISLVLCYVMSTITKYPHSFNYTEKITEENAEIHYKAGSKMMRFVNLSMAVLLFLVNYQILDVALNGEAKQMTWTNYALIIIVTLMTIVPLVLAIKGKNSKK